MSSGKLSKLRSLFNQLRHACPTLEDYQDRQQAFDALFEMFTADSAIAGIAQRLLDGDAVPHEYRPIVQKLHLRADGCWLMMDGTAVDLTPYPELLSFAQILEGVRKECAKCV